ncbi:MAG: hypothetical protein E7080_00245 [Bacteroidales bacterium]|nr:hypothetical protein [Bacteroidales bacterium]
MVIKNKKRIINDLTTDEITLLYVYCANFDKIIELYSKNKFKKEFNKIVPDKNIIEVKQKDVLNTKNKCQHNQMYCVIRKNKPISFLTHLRNAIAHGNLIYFKDNNTYEIIDKTIKKHKGNRIEFYTAYGLYAKDSVLDLITLCLSKLNN